MGLLDSIERLITEHGSAAILRERIALANDKHAALERKATTLEAENGVLKVQLQAAESENKRVRAENAALKERPPDSKANSAPCRLEELREKILQLLAERDGLVDQQIAQTVGVGLQVTSFHLEELQSANMVRCTLRVGQRATPWHLSQEGRRYLVINGLVA